MTSDGSWQDTFQLARWKDSGFTASIETDGWQMEEEPSKGPQIDYILQNSGQPVSSSKVVLNGVETDVISDHFETMAEISEND